MGSVAYLCALQSHSDEIVLVMRINIVDEQIKFVLNLSSEEIVHLMRLQPLQVRRSPFQIVSPVLIACGDSKHEVEIIKTDESGNIRALPAPEDEEFDFEDFATKGEEIPRSGPPEKKKKREIDPTERIPSFVLTTELTPELFKDLVTNKQVALLLRIQNIPAYALVEDIRVNVTSPGEAGNLVMRIDRVRPITELLKTQLTESSFYETFIVGKSEEFFESTGTQLNDLVALVGVLRKEGESDTELRMRVKDYLKIRIAETTNIDDQELKALIRKAEEVQEIERLMDKAKREKKDER